MSIHADDEFSLRTGLEIELDDVVPGDGLADVIITRYRRGRRRRVAGAIGLVIVFAGIGVPLGLGASTPADPGHTILRLAAYTLTLPGQYQLVAARSAPCRPSYGGTVSAATLRGTSRPSRTRLPWPTRLAAASSCCSPRPSSRRCPGAGETRTFRKAHGRGRRPLPRMADPGRVRAARRGKPRHRGGGEGRPDPGSRDQLHRHVARGTRLRPLGGLVIAAPRNMLTLVRSELGEQLATRAGRPRLVSDQASAR